MPDVSIYKEWSIDTVITWIKSLDGGKYSKYCDILRQGFISDGIPFSELPNLEHADLRMEPFKITSFADGDSLIHHFKSLQIYIPHTDADIDEEGNKYFCNAETGVSQWEDPRGCNGDSGTPLETPKQTPASRVPKFEALPCQMMVASNHTMPHHNVFGL